MRTKADFRAARERCGISKQHAADSIGVGLQTLKRWERPGFPDPPEDAWAWLDSECARFDEMLNYAVGVAVDSGAPSVVLTYYRSQEQFDECGRDSGYYGFANALARAVGEELSLAGLAVEYRYPDDGAVSTPGSNY